MTWHDNRAIIQYERKNRTPSSEVKGKRKCYAQEEIQK